MSTEKLWKFLHQSYEWVMVNKYRDWICVDFSFSNLNIRLILNPVYAYVLNVYDL